MGRPARVGLIGAGRWGRVYLRTLEGLRDRCVLTHLASSNPESASLVPATVKLLRRWQDLVKADCDAVIIATPPATHAEILEACFEAGKPCLVEKPLCLDAATAERLLDRARASRVPVLVDHIHLFSAAYQELRRMVRDAREPVRLIISEGTGLGPFRQDTPVLWDRGPHDVGLCLDLMERKPESLAVLGGPAGPDGHPEAVAMRLEFGGDAAAWINIGRVSAVKRRRFAAVTDTKLYVFDDLSETPLTVATVDYAGRHIGGMSDAPALEPVRGIERSLTLPRVVRYFLDGLSGGDRGRFGLELAVDVTRVLADADEALRSRSPRPA